jgi:hypothetical protein
VRKLLSYNRLDDASGPEGWKAERDKGKRKGGKGEG